MIARLRRRPSLVLGLTLLVTGCAAMQNTVAQELAWERWEKCKHFPTVTLKDIRTDGEIWVWTYYDTNYASYKECIAKAAKEQAERRVTVAPLSTTLTPTGAPSGPAATNAPPNLRAGSEWAYRSESPQGKSTFVWVLDREEVREGAVHYIVKTGTREILWRKNDLAYTSTSVDGTLEVRWAPAMEVLRWPLVVGTEWQQTYTVERPTARTTEEMAVACKIEAQETVVVPAGSFQTFKSTCTNKRTGKLIFTIWYAPEVGGFVREISPLAAGGERERELIQYRLR